MAEIELWVAVRDCREQPSRTRLLKRTLETPFLPREGDHVRVAGESISLPVKRVTWEQDGSIVVGFTDWWIDPPPPYDNMTSDGFRQWWTDQDGDLFEILEAAGWHH